MQQSIWDEIKAHLQKTDNVIIQLIYINVGIFLIESIFSVFYFLFTGVQFFGFGLFNEWLGMPADSVKLIYRFWTPFTYMFLHGSFLHLLMNMLVLYWFGRILQQVMDIQKALPLYIYGGLLGGAFFLLAYNLFPAFEGVMNERGVLIGASAGVMAIVIATARLVPNYTLYLLLFGPVKIKYIALFLIGVDVFYGIGSSNAGGSFAHLGGALFGYLFVDQLSKGKDWSVGFNRMIKWIKSLFSIKRSKNITVEYKSSNIGPSRYQYMERKKSKQKQIDAILDKIAQSGYDSLTEEEKEFLFRASKEDE